MLINPYREVTQKAKQFGFVDMTDDQVETVLWGATGWPGFWPRRDKDPLQNLQKQLYDFFKKSKQLGSIRAGMQEIEDEMDRMMEEYKNNNP